MKNKHELGAIIILNIAKNNRPEVNALLLRNGVSLPNEASDLQVAQVLTELLKKSKTFKNEFLKLVENSQVLNEFSNVDGKIDFSQYNVPNTFNGTVKPLYANTLTSSIKTPEATKSSGTGFTLDKGLGVFSQALNGFLQYNQNLTDQKLAEASIAQSNSSGGNVNPDDGKGMGTGMTVLLILLGLGAVGGGIWFYMKNKK
jgi:hypothetical protein